jgi:conjugative transfer region protein TrbK
MPAMDPKMLVRIIAVVLLAATLLACAVELGRLGPVPEPSAASPEQNPNPLSAELTRCKALGDAAVDDAACKEAWTKSRERFFGNQTPQQNPHQDRRIDPFPATPDAPPAKAKSKIFLDRAPSAPQPNPATAPNSETEGR